MEQLQLSLTWRSERLEYLHELSLDVARMYHIDDFFDTDETQIFSKGSTSFVVEKTGWQTYHIRESIGNLRHVLEIPRQESRVFHSTFVLQNTSANFIRPSLVDIYFRYTQLLKPKYKQIGSLTPGGDETIYHHTVIALIKIRFFPVPRIGNTIYLVSSKRSTGTWVPIGYAIYSPSS